MNPDIDIFVNFINQSNAQLKGKKRTADVLTSEDIVDDVKIAALDRLKEATKSSHNLKGRDLTKYINALKETFGNFVNALKSDKQVDNPIPELIKLWLCAEFSVSVILLDQMYEYAIKNKLISFNDCFKFISINIKTDANTYKSKKPRLEYDNSKFIDSLKNNITIDMITDEDEDEEEEDEDYEDNSDTDSSSSDMDMEDEEIITNPTTNKKEHREFINQIFKSREDDNEKEVIKHYSSLPEKERITMLEHIKEINNYHKGDKPILFQIMDLPLPIEQKNHILKNYSSLATSRHPDNKLKTWFNSLMSLPFGKYKGIDLKSIKPSKIKKFIDSLDTKMNKAVYGHDEAKRHIIQMMGQQIRNPTSKGNVLGIYGPAGNGKTTIIKEGIAKALDKPFMFISLGGATDSSFLVGHSYTYEGSICGRIAQGLITSKCMDPIIYFDELDKISKTPKGDEITNLLVHLTDPVQNSHFRDKYFHGIDIDLSRATMIFSFNDPSNVNPILLDRITTVETKYLLLSQKIHIATNYLLPEMMKDMGLAEGDVMIEDNTLRYLIDNYTHEGGVRKLKSLLYNIVRELNLANLIKGHINEEPVHFPFTVNSTHIKYLLKNKRIIELDMTHTEDTMGIINGLYASSDGSHGGILPIQLLWVPSTVPLEVKATGHLQQVIKESTQVASTLAFNYLEKDYQDILLKELKDYPRGIHIHFPDGSTPKDGPSAGAAITVAILSLLTKRKIKHDIGMTGEINLQGKVTAIGGLDNKLEGAKRAGIKLVLCPKENQKDLDKIKERNPTLFEGDFKVVTVETLSEALSYALA